VSSSAIALAVGTALAVAALAFVLYPLFFSVTEHPDGTPPSGAADDSAILALREIEFDRATGKLSEADYAELKTTYSARALQEIRGTPVASADVPPLDDIEARARSYRLMHRECPTCGVRPEPDAIYCSTCGAYLQRACPRCSAEITESGASFCSHCGTTLAARGSAALI
jgi:hypothetical protein